MGGDALIRLGKLKRTTAETVFDKALKRLDTKMLAGGSGSKTFSSKTVDGADGIIYGFVLLS